MQLKPTIILLLVFLLGFNLKAQNEVRDDFTKRLQDSYASLKTLKSNFKQKKAISIMKDDLLSSGIFYYQKPDKMKWDQLEPDPYYFLINEDEIIKFDGRKRQDLSPNSPQAMIFKEFILGTVDGSIFSDNRFKSTFTKKEGEVEVVLIPIESNLKRRIANISLLFNNSSLFLESLVIEEKGGDLTRISFYDQELNKPLSQSTFE